MIILGIIVSFGFMLLGWLAIRILYGEAYMAAVPVLSVLIWATSLSQLGTVNGIWIVSEGYGPLLKYTVWAGALANLLFNALLIPVIGIVGAAVGTFMAQFTVQFIAPAFISPLRAYFKIYAQAIREVKNIPQYISAGITWLRERIKK